MLRIDRSLDLLADALISKTPIICDSAGNWRRASFLESTVQWLTGNRSTTLLATGRAFCAALDKLEKSAVIITSNEKIIHAQKYCASEYLKAANAVKCALEELHVPQAKKLINQLAQRVAGLEYRIGVSLGGQEQAVVDKALYRRLEKLAAEWKRKHPLYVETSLSSRDKEKLQYACTYENFANLLLIDRRLRKDFFTWIIRDHNGVDRFVEFPSTCQKIKAAFLAARVGRLGGHMLTIEEKPREGFSGVALKEKALCLPFQQKEGVFSHNILDDSKEVVLNGGWCISIKKIFHMFSQKNRFQGDIEFFGPTGVTNWNCYEFGSWNPNKHDYDLVDLSAPEWWKSLPVFEELSKKDLESKFRRKLKKGEWLLNVLSTRQTLDLDFAKRHTYIEVGVPMGNGRYRMFTFGKHPLQVPETIIEKLRFLNATHVAKLSYPDPNVFFSQRQLATHSIVLSPKQGNELMGAIQKDLLHMRQGNMIIQFAYENCAEWVHGILEAIDQNKTNLFKIPVLDSEPLNPVMAKIFHLFRKSPKSWQPYLLGALDTVLGASYGITVIEKGVPIFKCAKLNPHRQQQIVFQPGYIHKLIEQGEIEGQINFGF